MKRMVLAVLLVFVLSACTPAVAPISTATPTRAAVPATSAPTTAAAPANTELPAATAAPAPTTTAAVLPWSLVAVGDSISFNSPDDCHGCTGFVDRYAAAISEATGHPVKAQNLSQHNDLQVDGLLQELNTDSIRRAALAGADIILVSIAHNDTAWNRNDDPCDGPNGDNPDWSKYNATCAAAAAEIFRPKFESLYAQIVALRAGKPTVFRTINAYNDWIGQNGTPAAATDATRMVLDAWNAMVCKAAQTNGFTCADIYHAFNGADGLTPALDLLANDYTHPSDTGNAVIARVLTGLGYAPLMPNGAPPAAVIPAVVTPAAIRATAAAATPDPQQLASDLDKTFQQLTTANEFSGSVVIAQDGKVILSKAYGLADRANKTPNTVQTKFRIYEMTRSFTALAIMMLQEQGKLKVQDSICAYLTACPEAWKPVTIHQLLTLTSGIPDNSDAFSAKDVTSSAPLDQMIAEAKTKPLDFQPGAKFSNDDINYVLLGKIIEAVAGQSYAAFMQKNIFDPLQMSNTGYEPNRADLAVGYKDESSVADPLNMSVMFSAGGLYSTAEDIYRWDQALDTDKLVPQRVLDTVFTSYVQSDRDGYGYGYGWFVSLDKPSIRKQSGHASGFDTTIRRYPDDKAAIIILTNLETTDMVSIADAIAARLTGK